MYAVCVSDTTPWTIEKLSRDINLSCGTFCTMPVKADFCSFVDTFFKDRLLVLSYSKYI
jgi:hypothetical protein